MNRRTLLIANLIVLMVIGSFQANAQNDETGSSLRPFGIGLHMQQFKRTDISMDLMSPTKIILTLNPTNGLRIEPEIGFAFAKDSKDKAIHFGLGIFGMVQKKKLNIYGGARIEYTSFTSTRYFNDYYYGSSYYTAKYDYIQIGPALGCEYLFGEHFSVGGEVAVKYFGVLEEGGSFITDSGLLMRFYF